MPMNRPTGWVYLHSGNCTICWRRGDDVAYVLSGRQLESYPGETPGGTALAVIKVSPRGWVDLAGGCASRRGREVAVGALPGE